jgi:multiple antibiotic resistance protein
MVGRMGFLGGFGRDLEFLILSGTSLFAIVSPLSAVPSFLAMTPHDTPAERCRMARTACWTAAGVLAFFALTGHSIFTFMGISLPAFQIAGGVFLFLIALDLLRAREGDGKITDEEQSFGEAKQNVAITPLAVPLIAGPGAISTTILLRNEAGNPLRIGLLFGAIALVMLATYYIFKYSARGTGWLSPVVLRVTRRIMGLLLGAIAVQFVINGAQGAWAPKPG